MHEPPVSVAVMPFRNLSPEPDMDKQLDLKAVALGAGEPDSWAQPYGYEGDCAGPITTMVRSLLGSTRVTARRCASGRH